MLAIQIIPSCLVQITLKQVALANRKQPTIAILPSGKPQPLPSPLTTSWSRSHQHKLCDVPSSPDTGWSFQIMTYL